MDDYTFAMQQRTFDVHGYALNPSNVDGGDKPIVGSLNQAYQNGFSMVDGLKVSNRDRKEAKRKRNGKGDTSIVDGEGAYLGPWAEYEGEKEVAPEIEEEAEEWRAEKKRREEAKEAAQERLKQSRDEKSIFHGACNRFADECVLKTVRQGSLRLRGSDVHAHPDRHRCQAQPVGGC